MRQVPRVLRTAAGVVEERDEMTKKLYHVEITVMVMAENETDAKLEAVSNADILDCEANSATSVASEWYDAIPWGETDDRTCGQILKAQRIAAAPTG